MKRKNICLITAYPESLRGKRLCKGLIAQCRKYGYNLSVFAVNNTLDYYTQSYTDGEVNIYNLINCEKFDGIIVDTLTIIVHKEGKTKDKIFSRISETAKAPVVSLGEYESTAHTIYNNNDELFRETVRHMTEHHGYRSFAVLTGFKGHVEAENRLNVILDELQAHGISVDDDHIYYGDFWYLSGKQLADDIISGKISRPEAIIAASDHMAIGAVKALSAGGIRVPDDIAVIGFEGTNSAMLNDIPVTSYKSNDLLTAASAIDYIRNIIEPDEPIIPYDADYSKAIHFGSSCGCTADTKRIVKAVRESMYSSEKDYTDYTGKGGESYDIDISTLMDNYIPEILSGSTSPNKCLENIFSNCYIMDPYENFWLCLNENWLNPMDDHHEGYPDKMGIYVRANSTGFKKDYSILSIEDHLTFDRKLMLPKLFEDTDEPSVFYFSSIHFNEKILGYSVLQRKMENTHLLNHVYRNWLRFIGSSLEMIRIRNMYMTRSLHDEMTGLYNRHGMYTIIANSISEADDNSSIFASVIDMDGLKYINDNFGHEDGDFGIITVSRAASEVTEKNEICVRAGGDEFYIVGIGKYTETDIEKRIKRFEEIMTEAARKAGKPYPLSASIGCAIGKIRTEKPVREAIAKADEKMYKYKVARKRNRI